MHNSLDGTERSSPSAPAAAVASFCMTSPSILTLAGQLAVWPIRSPSTGFDAVCPLSSRGTVALPRDRIASERTIAFTAFDTIYTKITGITDFFTPFTGGTSATEALAIDRITAHTIGTITPLQTILPMGILWTNEVTVLPVPPGHTATTPGHAVTRDCVLTVANARTVRPESSRVALPFAECPGKSHVAATRSGHSVALVPRLAVALSSAAFAKMTVRTRLFAELSR